MLLVDDSLPPVASQAILRILEEEKGYVNNPNDKGLETKYGITKRWYPTLDIKNLTSVKASKIYYRDYWCFNKCDKLPQDIALTLFDSAVNQGGNFARKALQQTLNVKADGIIGSKTIAAAFAAPSLILITQFTRLRCQQYTNLVQADISQVEFIEGWVDRALDILLECQIIAVFGGDAP
ncbi:hypothetical protein A9Q74_06210 [Colwellia sp. 39_35_sub15_T18]|nr:hypothetical protein A9Q74_06210 [Colwellia sp. 39_35_sub15_T18]